MSLFVHSYELIYSQLLAFEVDRIISQKTWANDTKREVHQCILYALSENKVSYSTHNRTKTE